MFILDPRENFGQESQDPTAGASKHTRVDSFDHTYIHDPRSRVVCELTSPRHDFYTNLPCSS